MTAPESLASPAEMDSRSLGAITATSHPFLEQELAAASRLIRDACRWHVAPKRGVTYRRRGRYREQVWLPAMQIESVEAVTIDGIEWDADRLARVDFDPDTGWTNLEAASIDIKFTAGYTPIPETLKSLTLQVAARALGSPLGLVREQAGTVAVTHTQVGFNQAGGVLLLPTEDALLAEYRIGRLP